MDFHAAKPDGSVYVHETDKSFGINMIEWDPEQVCFILDMNMLSNHQAHPF